jgi:arylsulfatase A-like enzyme
VDAPNVAPSGAPNIVLIVLDTLTADAAGLGRSPARMPSLQRLADDGMAFTHAVANAPWTYPSHASLFTGLLPSEHRMENPRHGMAWGRDLARLREWMGPSRGPRNDERLAERWLPAVLQRAGYATAMISNNPFVSRAMSMDVGFDHVRDTLGVGFMPMKALRRVPRHFRPHAQAALLASRVYTSRSDMLGGKAVADVRRWLSERDGSKPFLLFANLLEAHYPYLTPDARGAIGAAGASPLTAYRAMLLVSFRRIVEFNLEGRADDHRPALRLMRELHRAAALYLDRLVSAILDASRRTGRPTLFCITADHGEEFGEHDALTHMFTLDEPALHVPLVLSGPGVPAGDRGETVSLMQVYSTALEAAGVPVPRGAAPSLLGSPAPAVIAERERIEPPEWTPTDGERAQRRIGRTRAVYRGSWKLVSDDLGIRLYDLARDAFETRDESQAHADVVTSMQEVLPAWPEPEEEVAPSEDGGPGLSAEEEAQIKDQLAALGYLE